MNKIIFILILALLSIALKAQSEKQPDSLLIYSFSQNGDSTLGAKMSEPIMQKDYYKQEHK